jgi:hypothetical protein
MRCPYCSQEIRGLSLYLGGKFCSGAHQAAYAAVLEKAMLQRLRDSAQRLQCNAGSDLQEEIDAAGDAKRRRAEAAFEKPRVYAVPSLRFRLGSAGE